MEIRETKIISGLPAIGKTYSVENSKYRILDLDSSNFTWTKGGLRDSEFPRNYINHLINGIGQYDYILISSHEAVRRALEKYSIEYTMVYPSIELKDEYLQRFKSRGNDENFIAFIDSNWDQFIKDIDSETYPDHIILDRGEFLSDALESV